MEVIYEKRCEFKEEGTGIFHGCYDRGDGNTDRRLFTGTKCICS